MSRVPEQSGRSGEDRSAQSSPVPGTGSSRDSVVVSADDIGRALVRMAHEIVERNRNLDVVHIIGIQRGGVWLAERLAEAVRSIVPEFSREAGSLDVSLFRDDISLRPVSAVSTSRISGDLVGATVVLVDDVLFTGRTVRAALDALTQFGRPGRVQLAVLVDRGHRELPLRADYVGKNLPTSREAEVVVTSESVRIIESGER